MYYYNEHMKKVRIKKYNRVENYTQKKYTQKKYTQKKCPTWVFIILGIISVLIAIWLSYCIIK